MERWEKARWRAGSGGCLFTPGKSASSFRGAPSETPADGASKAIDWRFVFDLGDDVERPADSILLLVFPTIEGVTWAQREKNNWILKSMPVEKITALLILEDEPNALPRAIVERALGFSPLAWNGSLPILFLACNDQAATFPNDSATRSVARQWRARLDAAWQASAAEPVPWHAVEKEVLNALWESWSSESPIEERVRQHLAAVLSRHRLSGVDPSLLNQLERRLLDHLTGLGPLEPFLRDPDVNEIMINGTARVYIERAGEMSAIAPPFDHETHLKTLIERIVAPSGRRVDWAAPFCDVRLKDGSRVNIVLPPLALDGPCVTIRRFRAGFTTMDDLLRTNTVEPALALQLERAVRDRRNIVIAGNTGAGKTTLMNVLASFIPNDERILTMEDAAELSIAKPHVVRMETRPANTEGKGRISMRDLVLNALRMRPDRLLVGECRGDEVIPMLQAMNTGHDGSMTTLHANSADEVGSRLEAMVSMAAPAWTLDLIRQQIRSAVDIIVYMKRDGALRRVVEVRDVV